MANDPEALPAEIVKETNQSEKKGRRGGPQPGSGRPPGTVSMRLARIAHKLAEAGTTPLEVMVEAMLHTYLTKGAVAAFPLAEKCAPYMHPKLNAVAVGMAPTLEERFGKDGTPLHSLHELTDEQLLIIAAGDGLDGGESSEGAADQEESTD